MIRSYKPGDLQALREITAICFDGTSVDQNIEKRFGPVGRRSWQDRKAGTIDADAQINPEGVFVSDEEGEVIGYISCRIDPDSCIGWIPNLSVLPGHQQKGIGKALMERALEYFETSGMELVRIETLEQNPVGPTFYPRMGFQEIARQIHYALPIQSPQMRNAEGGAGKE